MNGINLSRARVRAAAGEDAAAWRSALTDPAWLTRAQTLKLDGPSWVRRVRLTVGGIERDVVVKYRSVHGVWPRTKLLAGGGRLNRHWRNAHWLLANGFTTPRPLFLAQTSSAELLVMEYLEGGTVLDHLAHRDLTVRDEHAVARALGRDAARMWALGRYNRDHKPSNLIVVGRGPSLRIAILDCVAIRRCWFGPLGMLAALVIEPTGTGCPPRKSLMARTIREFVAPRLAPRKPAQGSTARDHHDLSRACWSFVESAVIAHGDPRPRINPLSAPPPRDPSSPPPR